MKPEKPTGKVQGDLPKSSSKIHGEAPLPPFAPAQLSDVFGMFKGRVALKTDEEIAAALLQDAQKKWRDRD